MLRTLDSQLHFVQDIQSVDTDGVEPLRSISDVTPQALKEREVTIEDLKEGFEAEELVEHRERTRWRSKSKMLKGENGERVKGVEDWDVLGLAEKTEGKYFVVEGREQSTEEVAADEVKG